MSIRRLSVSLKEFFEDERSLLYIILDDRFKIINHLRKHIKEFFGLKNRISLVCNGHLLPSSENIDILSGFDTIEVIRSPFSKSKLKTYQVEPEEELDEEPVKIKKKRSKRKNPNELLEVDPPDTKKRKRNQSPVIETNIESPKINGSLEVAPVENQPESEVTEEPEPEVTKEPVKINGFKKNEPQIQILKVENLTPNEPKTKKPSLFSIGDFLSFAKEVNLKFNETNSPVQFTAQEAEAPSSVFITKRRRRVRHRKSRSRIDETCSVTSQSDFETKEPIRTQANPSLHLRFTDSNFDRLKELDLSKSIDSIKYSVDVSPKVGDVIAFKLYELSDSYEPGVSNWVIAQVNSWCDTSKDIGLDIIAGRIQTEVPTGKFDLTEDILEEQSQDAGPKAFLNYSSFIQPRLLILN